MLFFVNSRMGKGVTRDQIIEHFSQDFDPKAWELVKKGILSQLYYKVGDEPVLIALINCDSIEEAPYNGRRHTGSKGRAFRV